jgi:peptidoglycan/LPS O-acetylase OafA/YrhL
MRSVRKVDPADLWFGVVFGVVAAGVFALAAIVAWDSVTRSSFWTTLMPMLGLVFGVSIVRGPIGRLGRSLRFLCWFGIGAISFALFAVIRGETFNPVLAAGVGLGLAIVDLVTEYSRQKREAEHG